MVVDGRVRREDFCRRDEAVLVVVFFGEFVFEHGVRGVVVVGGGHVR